MLFFVRSVLSFFPSLRPRYEKENEARDLSNKAKLVFIFAKWSMDDAVFSVRARAIL